MSTAEDDDLAWFALLAGRDAAHAKPGTAQEAAALRAMVAQPQEAPAGAPSKEADRTERLIAAARARGLLDTRDHGRHPTPPLRHVVRWAPRLAFALGLLGMVGSAVWWSLPGPGGADPAGTERASGAVQRLRADDPAALREQLTQVLRAAGAEVHPYERLGRLGLDADLPRPVPPALRTSLAVLGVRADSEVLQVEIESARAASSGKDAP